MQHQKTVFISGATGYLESALIPTLLGHGHTVHALVRPGSEGKIPLHPALHPAHPRTRHCTQPALESTEPDSFAPDESVSPVAWNLPFHLPHPAAGKGPWPVGTDSLAPAGCIAVVGNALDGASFAARVPEGCTYVHLLGVPRPAPWKGKQFRAIDLPSIKASLKRPWLRKSRISSM